MGEAYAQLISKKISNIHFTYQSKIGVPPNGTKKEDFGFYKNEFGALA
jgi:hypothetical protein